MAHSAPMVDTVLLAKLFLFYDLGFQKEEKTFSIILNIGCIVSEVAPQLQAR